jgi:hypothetical protein
VFLNLKYLSDAQDRTLLMISSEAGNFAAVKYFIKCGMPIRYRVNGECAIDFACRRGHEDIMLELLQADSCFPLNYDSNQATGDLKKFIERMEEMHKRIEKDDKVKISQIIEENSHLRYFFDTKNETAKEHALKIVGYNAYEVLTINHLNYSSAESCVRIIESLSLEDREKIRQINFKHTQKFCEKHIIALMSFSTVVKSKNGLKMSELLNYVNQTYNILDNIPKVRKILELTSHFKNLQIVFDFENENLQSLDPTAGPFDNGSFYHNSGQIAIAAQNLLDPNLEHIVIGALAHELCHLAIFMAFDNMAKPYVKNDFKSEKELEEILKFCELNKEKEQIIEWVYGYDENLQHIELAVRVVHILAHYHNQPEKVKVIEKNFEPLFKNYNEKIIPKIEQKILNLEGKEEKLNKQNSLLWKLIFLLSILLPIGIILAVFYVHTPTYSWSTLTPEQKSTFSNAKVNFYGFNVKFKDLFANNSDVYDVLSSEQIKFGLRGNYSALSKVINLTYKQKIFLNFSNMTENLKEKFVSREVNFQGKKVEIKEILWYSEVLNFFTSSQILQIFEKNPINISSQTEVKAKFFVERFFTEEKIEKINRLHYKDGDINDNNNKGVNFIEVLEKVQSLKVFILSSPAGEGKSETFRNFALKLKEKFPQNWIQFVDFKKHFKAFKSGVKFNLTQPEELLNFLALNLLNLNKLESEIFRELFNSNRVIFLWDGIDEISPLYKDFMLDLTSTINNSSKKIQFISTRPQFSKDFSEKLKVRAYNLIPMGNSSKLEFLVKFIASEKFHIDAGKIWESFKNPLQNRQLYQKNEKLFKTLELAHKVLNIMEKSGNMITNPLFLQMISEIFLSELPVEICKLDFYFIYNTFIEKKLKIVRTKGEIVANDLDKITISSSVNVIQVHQAYALRHIFKRILESNSNFKVEDLQIMSSISKSSPSQISRYGILDVISESDFTFVHQSFAEFLVAQFLIDNFKNFDLTNKEKDSDLKVFLLKSVLFGEKFDLINKFLLNFAKIEDKVQKYSKTLKSFKPLKQKIDDIFYKVLQNFSFVEFENFFKSKTSHQYINCLNFSNELIAEVDKKIIRYVLLSKNEKSWTLLHEITFYDANENFLQLVFGEIQKFVNNTEISSLIFAQESDWNETSLMWMARSRKSEELKVFWNFLNKNLNENEKIKILMLEEKASRTALQFSMFNKDPKSFVFMKEIFEKFYTQEEIREIFMKTHKRKLPFIENVIYDASPETALEVSKYLENLFKNEKIELRKILNHRDYYGDSIFSWFKDKNEFEEKLKIFIELLRKTCLENQQEEFEEKLKCLQIISNFFQNFPKTPDIVLFRSSWWPADFEFFIKYFDKIKQKIAVENLRKIFMSKDEKGWTRLHEITFYDANEYFLQLFFEKIQKILNNTEISSLIFAQESEWNETSLMRMAGSKKFEELKVFWNFLNKNLNENEKIKILMLEELASRTALQFSMFNKDPKSFVFMKEIFEKFYTQEEIREIFMKTHKGKLPFIYHVIKDASPETALEVSKYLKNLFKNEKIELRKILNHRDSNGDSIFSWFKDKKEFEEKLKIFIELLRKTFEENQEEENLRT